MSHRITHCTWLRQNPWWDMSVCEARRKILIARPGNPKTDNIRN